jgi:hypothetical protein
MNIPYLCFSGLFIHISVCVLCGWMSLCVVYIESVHIEASCRSAHQGQAQAEAEGHASKFVMFDVSSAHSL